MRTKVKAKNDSGITLVALIITIIILVILAAVTVKTLFNDKLVETAIKAGEDYKAAQGHEMNELGRIDNELKDGIKGIGSGEASKPSGIVGAISFGELTWNNGKASVVVTKNSEDSYTIEYKVTNEANVVTREYSPISSGEIITDLSLGDLVTARLTDGTNHGKPADLNVLDKNAPQVTLKLKEGMTAKGKKATVVATVVENESGVASYKFEYKLGTDDNYNVDSNGTITTSEKTQEYQYINLTELVENNLKVTVTDKAGNPGTTTLDVTLAKEGMSAEELQDPSMIGKTVEYTPTSGIFNTEGKASETASGSNEYSGYTFQYFKTQGQESGETAFTWKIWSIDSENLYLIADKGTTKKLYLKGVNGYNNGVKLLDDICNVCYSNSAYGATARNLKIEDVVDTAGITVANTYATQYGTQPQTYNFAYPKVWADNENTVEKAKANVSVPYAYTNNATTQLSSANPTWTYRKYESLSTSTFKANYGDLVVETGASNGGYWLSSRSFRPEGRRIECGLQYAGKNSVNHHNMYCDNYGSTVSYDYDLALRPLVTIPLSSVTVEETADGNIKISY